ncbi:MAG: hypothetical protein LBV08_10555 [Clostridiales bacterium]|nr:hypothetical protein [Clostridiales bacterium]
MHNDIIEKLVKLDEGLRHITADAIKERENSAKASHEQCAGIEKKLKEEFESKLKEGQVIIEAEKENKLLKINNEKAEKIKLLEDNFKNNCQVWEDEIYNSIIGG